MWRPRGQRGWSPPRQWSSLTVPVSVRFAGKQRVGKGAVMSRYDLGRLDGSRAAGGAPRPPTQQQAAHPNTSTRSSGGRSGKRSDGGSSATSRPLYRLPAPNTSRSSPMVSGARALLAVPRGDRLHALWAVALAVGLRKGEALAQRRRDVDADAGTLRVGPDGAAGRRRAALLRAKDDTVATNRARCRRSHWQHCGPTAPHRPGSGRRRGRRGRTPGSSSPRLWAPSSTRAT